MSDNNKPVVIVTGASAGIGAAIVRRFVAGGYRVVAVARGQAKLDALAAQFGDDVKTLSVDVSAADAGDRTVAFAMQTFGRIDTLVNNAGSGKWAPIDQTEDAMMDEVITLGLKGPVRFSRAALPHMTSGGAIVNMGSTWGLIGGMGGGMYCAVKAALVGLTRSLATDYGPRGIRANIVAPGVIRTDMTEAYWDSDYFQRLNREMTPFDRDGTVEDVANAVFFLGSDQGSYINGQTIALDGGWSQAKYLAPEATMAERVAKAG